VGWAKPVPVNPWNLRYGPRVGNAIVAAAGPASNLAIAILAAVPLRLGYLVGAPGLLQKIVLTLVLLNVGLFVFNLIPLDPLDGISVLSGLVGRQLAEKLAPLRTYGPQILLGLIMLGFVLPRLNILGFVLFPIIEGISRVLLGF
jgi:Zn-dependent protease